MRFTPSPSRLTASALFSHFHQPEVREAYDILLFVEYCEAKYRKVRPPQKSIVHAFVDAYHDLWEVVLCLQYEAHTAASYGLSARARAAQESDFAEARELLAASRARRKGAKMMVFAAAGMQKAMRWLRVGGSDGRGGVYGQFKSAYPGFGPSHPRYQEFVEFCALEGRGPEGQRIYLSAYQPYLPGESKLADRGPAKVARLALSEVEHAPLAPNEPMPRKRTDYMREYARKMRAAKKADKAEAKAIAKTARAEALRKIYEPDIDPLS